MPATSDRPRFSRSTCLFPLAACLWAIQVTGGCASRNYTNFLLDEPIQRNKSLAEGAGPAIKPESLAGQSVMKVRWNDGRVFTEVDVPLLASGQRILVEHTGAMPGDKGPARAKPVVAPPPGTADKTLSDAYKERGLKENPSAPDVSLTRTRPLMQEAIRAGNYTLALEYCEAVLARYPSHPEFLRAKGSVLLLMGEKEKAIETYEKAEEIESDPKVKAKLQELRKRP